MTAVVTRRLYRYEDQYLVPRRRWRDTPIRELRALAARVCRDAGRRPPLVVAGRGLASLGRLCSYQEGDRVVLARDHRTPLTLLHEVAHYLQGGRGLTHGPAFARRYLGLLARYAGLDHDELVYSAAAYGVAGARA